MKIPVSHCDIDEWLRSRLRPVANSAPQLLTELEQQIAFALNDPSELRKWRRQLADIAWRRKAR